jgi:hypothetical protein
MGKRRWRAAIIAAKVVVAPKGCEQIQSREQEERPHSPPKAAKALGES